MSKIWESLRLDLSFNKYFILSSIIILVSFIVVFTGYYIYQDVDLWTGVLDGQDFNNSICEYNREHTLILQPINTFTNIITWTCSVLCCFMALHDFRKYRGMSNKPNLIYYSFFSFLFSIMMLLTSIFSFLFHASSLKYCRRLDHTGILLLMSSMFVYNIFRVRRVEIFKKRNLAIISVIQMILYIIVYFYLGKQPIGVVFVPTVLIVLFTMYYYVFKFNVSSLSVKFLNYGVLSFALAFICLAIDRLEIYCEPHGWIQGHSFWHLLNGVSLFLIYLHYRTDEPIDGK